MEATTWFEPAVELVTGAIVMQAGGASWMTSWALVLEQETSGTTATIVVSTENREAAIGVPDRRAR